MVKETGKSWRPWDELGWSDEFMAEVQRAAIESAFRPRDEWDVDVDPESIRGKVLADMDALDAAFAKLSADIAALPWYRRWPVRVVLRWKGIRL